MFGASLVSSFGDSPETATEEALLHRIRSSCEQYPARVVVKYNGYSHEEVITVKP
jgi:hypothetical protein